MSAKNKPFERFQFESDPIPRCLYYKTPSELKSAWLSKQDNYATKIEMAIPIDVLRNLDKYSKGWYIVADINVLFHDISFLRSYIVGDSTCQLLTPITILNKIEEMCASDTTGVAKAAKQSLTQLEACSRHVRFDGDVEVSDSTDRSDGDETDEILKCCQKIMSHGIHVVLITKSRGLRTLAEIRGVHVYYIEEIKTGVNVPKTDGRHITPLATKSRQVGRTDSCIRYTPGHENCTERIRRTNNSERTTPSERRRRNIWRHIRYSRY